MSAGLLCALQRLSQALNASACAQRAMELSTSVLVVLDRAAVPLSRLWCLYEIGVAPHEKLRLLARGFEGAELAQACSKIDVDNAHCFDKSAKAYIHREIITAHGSLGSFTTFLKLRFMLDPTSYESDVKALLGRSADWYDFSALKAQFEGCEASRLACICCALR